MTRPRNQQQQRPALHRPTNFNGAAIIDRSGREIPITEHMLQRAFDELIAAWEKADRQRASN